MSNPSLKTSYVDRPDLEEVFSDALGVISFNGRVLRIEFHVSRLDQPPKGQPPSSEKRTPVARVAIDAPAAVELFGNLQRIIAAMEQQGLVKPQTKEGSH